MPAIHIHTGKMSGQSIIFDNATIFVGRGTGNDIQVKEKSVSRRHLKVSTREEGFIIEDLKSQNGTFINNLPIKSGVEIPMDDGNPFTIGDIKISITRNETDENISPEYWIDLAEHKQDTEKIPLYKDRRFTGRGQLELIYEVSTILMQSLDIDEICEKIMASLFQCLERIDGGIILLVGDNNNSLEEVISKSRDNTQNNKNCYSGTIVDRVIREGKAVIMSDTSLEAQDDLSESIELMKLKSLMCVPLICKSRVLGVIYVHSIRAPYGFRREDLYLFTGLSSPAALAIENALLFSRTKEVEKALKDSQKELTSRVEERTSELSMANKNLGLAYSQMRDYKDRLSILLQGEEKEFLISDQGQILGATEEAIESTGMNRTEVIGNDLFKLIDDRAVTQLRIDLKNALKGVFVQTSITIKGSLPEPKSYFAKLMHTHTETGKILILMIRESLPGERTFRKEVPEKKN